MSREVRHDGAGMFCVRFPFDRQLVDLIKTLPNRRWHAGERYWSVPERDVVPLVDLLHPRQFRFDSATVEQYRGLGGSLPLTDPLEAPKPAAQVRGLFDGPDTATGAPLPGTTDDYTVSVLNQRVQAVIADAFPRPVWLVGEISSFDRNAHKRHVTFQLVEKLDDGSTSSSIDATLFHESRRAIERTLAASGDPFRLEDEITVRMQVRVELYVPWGSYRVIVEELDVHYTLGEAARRREEIIRRLTEAGLAGKNAALPLPALPLRVGLITSLGSDAYNDVLRSFQESGFAFTVLAHGARVQGRATEPSVLNALDALGRAAERLDVIVICRGGGSRTDLAWFDSEALGRAVAAFPLPVVVGIGHEQDHSVLDSVGRRAKTPTAAAALLVDAVQRSLDGVEVCGANVLSLATARISEARRRGEEWGRRLLLAARGLLERERDALGHRSLRAGSGARALLSAASQRLAGWARDVPRACSVLLARRHEVLDAARRAISQGARRDLASAGQRIDAGAALLGPRAGRVLAREDERASARDRRLALIHPRRVLERGYAILRVDGRGVVNSAGSAPAGTTVRAELRQGSLRLRSEGPDDRGGA